MSSRLRFRNVDADPAAPVEEWPFEGVVAALERGTITDWRRISSSIRRDAWGPVAREVEAALAADRPYGVAELFEGILARARRDADLSEREEAAREVRELVRRSGLAQGELAARAGTSASRMSTYCSGRVTPSLSLYVRMRRVAELGPRNPGSPHRGGSGAPL